MILKSLEEYFLIIGLSLWFLSENTTPLFEKGSKSQNRISGNFFGKLGIYEYGKP